MASELAEILIKKIVEHGDVPVYLPAETEAYHEEEMHGSHEVVCVGATSWINEEGECDRIMLMDPGAADAFG